jgi:fatty acid desaturase
MLKNPVKKRILLLLLAGFALIEFPGIFFINRIQPMVFGIPFIYSFVLVVWVYMCGVLFYAYRTRWGERPPDNNP